MMIFTSFFEVELRKSVMGGEEQADLEDDGDESKNPADCSDDPRKQNQNGTRVLLNLIVIEGQRCQKLCGHPPKKENNTHEQTKTSCEECHHCFIHLSEEAE